MAKKQSKRSIAKRKPGSVPAVPAKQLMTDLRVLIEQSRDQVARTVNSTLVWLYWNIGLRIREDVLAGKRAEYGEQIVSALSTQLTEEYGKGFGRRNLFRMMQFCEYFPREEIVAALSQQLSWSHFVEILPLDDPLKREFYLDLLFYHRRLRCLVAIDLKLGRFQAADKGQMELYLRWLEEYEVQPGEEPPVGLILCADKSDEHVRLLRLDDSGIRVARYLTELPERKLLERKLHEAIQIARQRLNS